jgi:hypothetical protein
MKYVAVDSGKYATKAMTLRPDGTEKSLVFRTKMEETIRNEAQGQSYIVEYGGKRYLLGEQAESNSAKSSKAEDLHKIATYAALHQLCNSGDEIVVAIGCPLSVYENPESKNAYKEFMFPSKQISIKVGDTTKHLVIRSVIVLPESSGIIFLEPEKYGKSLIAVIDIGGLNINCSTYNHGVPVLSTLYTDTLGSNVLTQNLKNALSTMYNIDIPQWIMDEILKEGYVVDNTRENGIKEGSREFIADFKKKHVQTILKKCEANGWNLSMMRLVFTGGTSEMLAEEIKSVLPGATIYPNGSNVNVRGFLKAITE